MEGVGVGRMKGGRRGGGVCLDLMNTMSYTTSLLLYFFSSFYLLSTFSVLFLSLPSSTMGATNITGVAINPACGSGLGTLSVNVTLTDIGINRVDLYDILQVVNGTILGDEKPIGNINITVVQPILVPLSINISAGSFAFASSVNSSCYTGFGNTSCVPLTPYPLVVPSGCTGACCQANGGCSAVLQSGCTGNSSYMGDNSTCAACPSATPAALSSTPSPAASPQGSGSLYGSSSTDYPPQTIAGIVLGCLLACIFITLVIVAAWCLIWGKVFHKAT